MDIQEFPYGAIWLADFEFVSRDGERPVPVCMVARELRSDRLVRLWQDDLDVSPPFPVGEDNLFVAYNAVAELSCFLVLGWQMPMRILDLYTEFKAKCNGNRPPLGWKLRVA